MKFLGIPLVALAAVSFAVASAEAAPKKITSAEEFVAAVAGKKLSSGKGNEVTLGKNGEFAGTVGGQPITEGAWNWDGKKFCRSLRTTKKEFPSACMDVQLDGNTVTIGKTSWTIN